MLQNYEDFTTNFRANLTRPHNKGQSAPLPALLKTAPLWGFFNSSIVPSFPLLDMGKKACAAPLYE
jgi:hypothetical protein